MPFHFQNSFAAPHMLEEMSLTRETNILPLLEVACPQVQYNVGFQRSIVVCLFPKVVLSASLTSGAYISIFLKCKLCHGWTLDQAYLEKTMTSNTISCITNGDTTKSQNPIHQIPSFRI